jgi:hypothetical protein
VGETGLGSWRLPFYNPRNDMPFSAQRGATGLVTRYLNSLPGVETGIWTKCTRGDLNEQCQFCVEMIDRGSKLYVCDGPLGLCWWFSDFDRVVIDVDIISSGECSKVFISTRSHYYTYLLGFVRRLNAHHGLSGRRFSSEFRW